MQFLIFIDIFIIKTRVVDCVVSRPDLGTWIYWSNFRARAKLVQVFSQSCKRSIFGGVYTHSPFTTLSQMVHIVELVPPSRNDFQMVSPLAEIIKFSTRITWFFPFWQTENFSNQFRACELSQILVNASNVTFEVTLQLQFPPEMRKISQCPSTKSRISCWECKRFSVTQFFFTSYTLYPARCTNDPLRILK